MKKVLAIMLAICILTSMVACGADASSAETAAAATTVAAPEATAVPTPEPTPEPTAEPTPEPSPEPTPEPTPEPFRNPLTGEITEYDVSTWRPYVSMLNTIKQALPQSSNSQADMLIEITEEGGITRVMGVYQDLTKVGNIGTIRSTREYFLSLCMGLDAIMIHCGGSVTAKQMLRESGYDTINSMYTGGPFWRDAWRKENVATEHSLYTSGEKILKYMSDGSIRAFHEEGFAQPYVFTEDGTPENGTGGTNISVSFSSYKTTDFVYDPETKTYKVLAYGEEYMDEVTNTQVEVTNVIVIPTKQTNIGVDGLQRFDLSKGYGYYACGGKSTTIYWEKGGDYDPLKFYNADGTDLALGVGKTYICVLGDTRPISIS